MKENRGHWYLLTGLVIGIALGLVYSWIISPLQYVDTSPARLKADHKDQYRALIAISFLADGNLERAMARLALLMDAQPSSALLLQSQTAQLSGRPEIEERALEILANSIQLGAAPTYTPVPVTDTPTPQPTLTISPTPLIAWTGTPTPTATSSRRTRPSFTATASITPSPTITPLPTRTPTATPGAAFVLKEQTLVCASGAKDALIQVQARDAANQPIRSVKVTVSWEGVSDQFFTGFKPDLGVGYADFVMTPGVSYSVQIAEGESTVAGLIAMECEAVNGTRYWGSWLLIFAQPTPQPTP